MEGQTILNNLEYNQIISMQFSGVFEETTLNPVINLPLNDLLILIIASFFLGRLYQQRQRIKNSNYTHRTSHSSFSQQYQLPALTDTWQIALKPSAQIEGNYPQLSQSSGQSQKLTDSKVKESRSQFKDEDSGYECQTQKDALLERIKIDGKKIQERGSFEMYFERNAKNLRLIRKIQKHEIISDYILRQNTSVASEGLEMVSFSGKELVSKPLLPDGNSRLEVQYYQNYQNGSNHQPFVQQRIVSLIQNPTIAYPNFENGRFKKLFRDSLEIGKGGFGTVIQAFHIAQTKKYAIKKIYMEGSKGYNKPFELERIFNEIRILSKISHGNIVQYHTSWLEYADFSQFEDRQFSPERRKNTTSRRSKKILEESSDRNYQASYYSNPSNQQIFFEQSSPVSKKRSFCFNQESEKKMSRALSIIKEENLQIASHKVDGRLAQAYGFSPVIYIQMELCKHSLADYIRRKTIPDPEFAFKVMKQIIQGVNFLHSKGIVHRDLKPQNIFLSQEGVVKIGDFGLSTVVDKVEEMSGKWLRAGTPSYIAPELLNLKKGDERSIDFYLTDVYSLGVIYYELLVRFDTVHQRGEKLNKLKEGQVVGLQGMKSERKLIKELTRIKNRPSLSDIIASQEFLLLNSAYFSKKQ